MVIFAIPLLATAVTGIVGGITYHITRIRNQRNGNNSSNQADRSNEQNNEEQDRKTEIVEGIQLMSAKKQNQNQQGYNQKTGKKEKQKNNGFDEQEGYIINNSEANKFICPITHQIIRQPAQLLCGHCFQKQKLIGQLKKNKKCPVCDKKSRVSEIYQSHQFKNLIQQYKAKKKARKLSRDRLLEDFGDDKFQFICRKGSEDDKALSDDEAHSSNLPQQIKIHKMSSVKII